MKYIYLVPLLALARPARAQHLEVIERAGLNLAWYGGSDASPSSFINRSSEGGVYRGDAYTNSPYLGLGLGCACCAWGSGRACWPSAWATTGSAPAPTVRR